MSAIWNSIKAWFVAQGGFAHGVAVIWLALVALYGGVPAFAALVNQVYAATPAWAHEVLAAAAGVIAWYANPASAKKGN